VISILSAADRIAMPWKNGGGITREVAVWPPGVGFDNFDWRVSIAEIRETGPFSRFENIDRTLTILRGRVRLTFENRAVELGPDSAPFAFPGEASCLGAPVDGSVTDLNVMTRRGRCTAYVTLVANETHHATAKITLLMARNETMVRCAGQEFPLQPYDALLTDQNCALMLAGKAVVIAIA
jgi:environmental stress-induced protein Ves